MSPLPSRKSLENMKRVDLQKLCKDYGVKANLKSGELIGLLLDTQKPTTKPTPSRRSVSSRITSRGGPSRISSVIIHDTDEEREGGEDEDEEEPQEEQSEESEIQPDPQRDPAPLPTSRTRKAKELQTKLGVGRPVAAGGSGARALTKSLSVPRGKRGKGSRAMKQTEATIPEEPELSNEPSHDIGIFPENGPSASRDGGSSRVPLQSPAAPTANADGSLVSLKNIDEHVTDALRPLHEQIQSLKSELELVQSLKAELGQLKAEVAEMGTLKVKFEALNAEVQDLRSQTASTAKLAAEFKQYHENEAIPRPPSTHRPNSPALKSGPDGLGLPRSAKASVDRTNVLWFNPSNFPNASSSNPTPSHPGIAPTMLGKRHRDSVASNITGVIEEGQEEEFSEGELAKTVIRPTKKRAKMSQEGEASTPQERSTDTGSQPQDEDEDEDEQEQEEQETPAASHVPTFTIFSGPDEPPETYLDPPPPTSHLPEFFASPSPPAGSGPSTSRQGSTTTSTANASENLHPFSFSFLPVSAPAPSMYMPSFPYPEPPQSPSPAGTILGGLLSQPQGDRTDIFQSFGLPSPVRPSRSTGSSASGFVNPAALTGRTSESAAKPVASTSETSAGTDASLTKKTMYGTELDGDTRFGDFGREGVGSSSSNPGFWAGGRF